MVNYTYLACHLYQAVLEFQVIHVLLANLENLAVLLDHLNLEIQVSLQDQPHPVVLVLLLDLIHLVDQEYRPGLLDPVHLGHRARQSLLLKHYITSHQLHVQIIHDVKKIVSLSAKLVSI